MTTAVVVLAAGGSSRIRRPKQLLTGLDGVPLLRRAAMAAGRESRPVVIVIGANSDAVRPTISDLSATIVQNDSWRDGIGSSIRLGIAAVESISPAVDAAILMLCDQPMVTHEVLCGLIDAHWRTGSGLVASSYAGTVGVPALFARRFFPELAAVDAGFGARRLLQAHAKDLVSVPFPGGAVDIDTEDDYRTYRAGLERE
ncbi:MAG: NTP transferase domain-containing protein [Capsulimonadaceae bacterium]